jgi:hypothetical protein
MEVETGGWSGDGDFTQVLVDTLRATPGVAALRVEDSPASRSDGAYLFLSNEIYVTFEERERLETVTWLGVIPRRRRVREPVMTLPALDALLAGHETIGPADYTDDGMLQYLRAERIVPPYQTRGYKLVEMVRIYVAAAGNAPGVGTSRAP